MRKILTIANNNIMCSSFIRCVLYFNFRLLKNEVMAQMNMRGNGKKFALGSTLPAAVVTGKHSSSAS